VVFSPDGTWLASAAERNDRNVRIWGLAKMEPIQVLEGHTTGVYALAVSHDGRWLAAGSTDGRVRLWDTTTWKEAGILKHGTKVYGLAFHPDGTRLACACADNTIRLWDLGTRQSVAELRGHTDYVHVVAWGPDGSRLISGSGDMTVRIWDSLAVQERMRKTKPGAGR
jgi:WD40 repeat protein